MKVLIIIPAYNEEENILDTVNKVKNIDSYYDIDYIVINDGSKDNTLKICQENDLNVINLVSNLGIGGAVQTGYKYAYENNYDVAIQFDGDGQHDENYINLLVDEIKKGNDFVIGSRYIGKESEFQSSAMRRFGKNILSSIIKSFGGISIKDPTSGFRAANKDVIKIFSKRYPIEYPEPETIVYLHRLGFKIKEVPVKMHEREHGKSSISPLKSIYYMFSVSLAIITTSLFSKGDK